jgi:hypothetical protein
MINLMYNFKESAIFWNLERESNKYYFLDLETRYVVKRTNLLFFSGNIYLIPNFQNYSVSDISISKTEVLLPKICDVKMEYRFSNV